MADRGMLGRARPPIGVGKLYDFVTVFAGALT
jgi:hypothetical protein